MYDLLIAPFADFGFLRRALVGCLALSVSAPVLGVFLVLRRMSLTADVLAHGALPGVALAFLLAGFSAPLLWFGGLVAGLLVAVGAGALSRATGGREDATLAALYLLALGLGVALISMGGGGGADITHILFGSVLGVDDPALLLMAGVATVTLAVLAFAWRPLVLECFDPAFAAAAGARGGLWHMVFQALVVVNVLSAFQALGTLMAVGLMMLPAIASRHWAREVSGMAYAAVGLALVSSYAGLVLSFHADVPSGPAIVLVAGGAWAVSVLIGPVDGLLPRLLRRRHLAG
ncbi:MULTISPECIES: metal ABC transporter permease [Neoroseomonas]|uniref:Metal ABC transporter permease n=2 Tax=Neoroseomonas TaxID=2870716 RepID=A0A9X9WK50_9PROT|nr:MULTISPECIES: metal ABC transporter permease [Neoroseomonas]MBR0660710.1 metal ABC transporter permease [Neoroseomonas oryzicola]NKE15338.1 metal ABC transporter permease [Neoroseomonas oryzicola]NMJ44038.1 metal ABC transporter permease [Neoroseomonas marina]